MDMTEIKSLLDEQGKAFDAFKKAHEEEVAELKKRGTADTVLKDRLAKIDKALDDAGEAKAAMEKKLAAEVTEREELELRMQRQALKGSDGDGAGAAQIKSFNDLLTGHNAARNQKFEPLDEKGLSDYRAHLNTYLRKGLGGLYDAEQKTMSVGSDPDGGYFVTPDMSGRMIKKVFETSEIRQIASQQTIGTDALEGMEDLGEAGAGYAGEHAVSGDTTTPQVGKWRIPVFWIDTEPKTTQQLLDDANVDVEGWLADKVADKFARFENNEFVNGAAAKIRGLMSYTAAADSGSGVTWGSVGYAASGAAGAFATTNPADALFTLIGLVKQAYLANARWLTRRSVITTIRKFKDGQGQYLWQPGLAADVPEMILGYPVTRAEDMPAVAANSLSMAFGDFRQAYQIVDRAGVRVLRDNLTAKPYVKFYTTKRTGGGMLNFEAIKYLKFAAS